LHEGPYELDQSIEPPRPENARQVILLEVVNRYTVLFINN